MDDKTQIQEQINRQVSMHIPDVAWKCTVPIVIAHEGAIHHFGTGTLFRIADHHFLITAGHVFKQASRHSKTLAIGGADDGFFIALKGQTIVSSEGQYGSIEDPLDIGLHCFEGDIVSRLKSKQFLSLDDIEFDPQSQTAVYSIFGFPAIWSKPSNSPEEKVTYKALEFTTHRYQKPISSLGEYQERLHILLDAEHIDISNIDGSSVQFQHLDGSNAPFPGHLGGISGCSVWHIGDLQIPIEQWSQRRSRLVAVETGVYSPESAIKATRWIAVTTLIHEVFPELRPSMGLWRQR